MGDGADDALDYLSDLDDAYFRGDEETSPFMYETKPHGPGRCPVCGGKTHVCSGPYGRFYGCDNFPHCKGRRGA
jgi:hypothetical protein